MIAAIDSSLTPPKLRSKDFEQCAIKAMEVEEAHMTRYGVQSTRGKDGEPIQLQSLPDFEGVIYGGRQFVFDCKVCSAASFGLTKYLPVQRKYGTRARQMCHMMERSRFGVCCFFLIHWNARELKTKTENARTVAFPVRSMPFWEAFYAGEEKSITRQHCDDYGVDVTWTIPTRCWKPRMQLIETITTLFDE